MEKFLKILQGATNLLVSNFLKNSFIYYSLRGFEVKSKKKKKKWAGPLRPTRQAGKPVKPAGKPVKPAGKPVARELLNLDLSSNRSNRPVNR